MKLKEKILVDFNKIIQAESLDNITIFNFLRDVYKLIYESYFAINERDDFTIKRVEGDSWFNSDTKTLYIGDINDDDGKKLLFDTLISMMQYYDFLMTEKPEFEEDKEAFKKNNEIRMAYEYAAAAITNYFLDDFCWPDKELQEVMKQHGIIDDLIIIQVFSQDIIPQIQYKGDLSLALEKIKNVIEIIQDMDDDQDELMSMAQEIEKYRDDLKMSVNDKKDDNLDAEKEEFLKNLLKSIKIHEND
ncbi:MAG: hypothetical protein ACTSWN_07110 [Promethearchaeota archaeon]